MTASRHFLLAALALLLVILAACGGVRFQPGPPPKNPNNPNNNNNARLFMSPRLPDCFFGSANATISSLVTSDPVRLPPVATTATNCRPSAPMYVTCVA